MAGKREEKIRTVLYMLVIAAAFTAVVSGVNVSLKAGIEAGRRLLEMRGALDALGVSYDRRASAAEIVELAEGRLKADSRGGLAFYRGYDADGELIGYVFPIGGSGFWGPIGGYVALDPTAERIIGITFVRQVETPGLGGRITEDWFRRQFVGKPIAPPEGEEYAIRLAPEGKRKGPGDIDAITGATGTSNAVENFLNENLAQIRRVMREGKTE